MSEHAFIKMHGAGNDFVIFDARTHKLKLTGPQAQALADRHMGVGCDQVIVMEPSKKADVFMRIYNADGGEVSSCGNATRCVAVLLMQEHEDKNTATIETQAGVLKAEHRKGGVVVNMGAPKLGWKDIPLTKKMDTLSLDMQLGALKNPAAVNMGNPHAVFFVKDAQKIELEEIGPVLEHHPLFPERANISMAQVLSKKGDILLRVWERGSGITLACGTAACATAVAAIRRGLINGNKATLQLPGGDLTVEWNGEENGDVWLGGPTAISFTGTVHL